MTSRNRPLFKTESGVKIYGPTSSEGKGKYYRIQYPDNGGFGHTTATTEALAKEKAAAISIKLKRGGNLRYELSGSDFIDAYLDSTTRLESGNKWGVKHLLTQTSLMKLHIRPKVDSLTCTQITNKLLKELINTAGDTKKGGSLSKAAHLRTAINAWIRWGSGEGWIVEDPDDLLLGLKNTVKNLEEEDEPSESGEGSFFVQPSDIPTHAQVDAVAKAAAKISGIWWYELMFNLAAYSGMRLGEIIDLDISQITLDDKTIRIEKQCLEAGGKKTRSKPKMRKKRTTVFPTVTPKGYPLLQEVERRMEELKALPETPTLIDGSRRLLLFPNKSGSWLSQGSFGLNVRRPAQEMAAWPKDEKGKFCWDFHSLRHVFCSYYLGELRQKASAVAIAAGHSSVFVTLSMYVGASAEAIQEMSAAN
jgi:integrase